MALPYVCIDMVDGVVVGVVNDWVEVVGGH